MPALVGPLVALAFGAALAFLVAPSGKIHTARTFSRSDARTGKARLAARLCPFGTGVSLLTCLLPSSLPFLAFALAMSLDSLGRPILWGLAVGGQTVQQGFILLNAVGLAGPGVAAWQRRLVSGHVLDFKQHLSCLVFQGVAHLLVPQLVRVSDAQHAGLFLGEADKLG